jgi:hypothetical protein
MKIFGLASLVFAASASFAAAGRLPKFEGDLAAIALPLSRRTPQLAGLTDVQSSLAVCAPFPHSYSCCAHYPAQNAYATALEMSGSFTGIGAELAGVSGSIGEMSGHFTNIGNGISQMSSAFADAIQETGGASPQVRLPIIRSPIARSRRAALAVPY